MIRYGQTMAEALKGINEKLKPSDGAGAYVKDFKKSDAPQFKGKSDEKKQKMAVAAYLDDKEENMKIGDNESVNENKVFVVRYTDPQNKKRFAIPFKDQKSADDKADQLRKNFKGYGQKAVKSIEVTKDILKRGVKFKEQYEELEEKQQGSMMVNRPFKEEETQEAVSPEQQAAIAISKKEKDDAILVDKKVKEEKTAFEKYTGVTNPRTEGRKSNYATDDEDEEGANKNIIMQLYKAISLRGRFDVVFDDGKKEKVKEPIAQKAIAIHRTFKTSRDRLAFQNKISKSYRDLLNAIR